MSFIARALPLIAGIIVNVIPGLGQLASAAILIGASVTSAVIQSALAKNKNVNSFDPGTQIQTTLTGGTNSRTIIVGFYATAGSEVCPPMSHGSDGDTPNAYLTEVFAIADAPIDSFSRLILAGEICTIGTSEEYYGFPVLGKYAGHAWFKFYDGRQTTANQMLVDKYSDYVRPWTSSRVGTGCSYGILTLLYNTDIYKSVPSAQFEVFGMRLYDPRKDSTVGGSGSHRWGDATTYEVTLNPIVIAYNIHRGIALADGTSYGGQADASDLPLSNWAAGMNVCDETVTITTGTEPRYRCGFEILIAEKQPADVLDELYKAASAQVVETGGVYKVRVGPPSLPVMFFTDDDFLVSSPQDFNPFPSITDSHNTVNATYPSPDEGWVTHDAPPASNDAYIAQDDGQPISADLQFPACPFPVQVQRNMLAWLNDDRRWRQHGVSFGFYGFALEPLDCISWTSAANGYDAKIFEISTASENMMTLEKKVALREVDPSDYDWTHENQLSDPITPGQWNLPVTQAVPGFSVTPITLKDANNTDRRPALLVAWTASAAIDANFLEVQVRLASSLEIISDDSISNLAVGQTILSKGLLPATVYQVRAQYIVDRPTDWTDWLSVTTGDVRLGDADIAGYQQLLSDTNTALQNANDALNDAANLLTSVNGLIGDLSDVQGQVDQNVTDISTLGSRVTVTETAIDTINNITIAQINTDIATANSEILNQGTAITNLQGGQADLNTYLTATSGSPNLLKNGGFSRGLDYWASSSVFVIQNANGWGNYAVTDGSSGTFSLAAEHEPCGAGAKYTFACDMIFYSDAGYAYLQIQWYDSSGNLINVSNGPIINPSIDFDDTQQRRASIKVTAQSPTGTVQAGVAVWWQSLSATSSVRGGSSYVGIRQAKFERNQFATPFTEQGATIDGMARIATEETVRSTADVTIANNLQTVSTTVDGHTATIASDELSINGLFARAAVTLDVNGYVTGWETNNNGSYGDFTIVADHFQIVNPGSTGARTEYSAGNWRVYDSAGTLRVRLGVW